MTSRGAGVLAIIPARGGSKGLPRKNVLEAGGRPLIAWTIDAALQARCVDRVVLSSDDDEIIAVARAWGCEVPFRRPPELATDVASTIDVVFHALENLPPTTHVVLLQPTSPLRTAADIDSAFALMTRSGAPSCVSVSPVEQTPYWMYRVDENARLLPLLEPPAGAHRRQDLPPVYALNGAVYVAQTPWLLRQRSFVAPETVGYLMPRERAIDIDTADDFNQFRRTLTEAHNG